MLESGMPPKIRAWACAIHVQLELACVLLSKMFVSKRPIVDPPTARGVVECDLKTCAAHVASGDDPNLLPPPSHENLRGCFGDCGRPMVAKGPECLTSFLAVGFVTPFQRGVCENRGDCPGIETVVGCFLAAAPDTGHDPVFTGSRRPLCCQAPQSDPPGTKSSPFHNRTATPSFSSSRTLVELNSWFATRQSRSVGSP